MVKWNDKVLATENTKTRSLLDKSSQTTHIPDQTAPWCLLTQKKRNGSPFRSLSHCKQHNQFTASREVLASAPTRGTHAWKETLRHCKNWCKWVDLAWFVYRKENGWSSLHCWFCILSEVGTFPAPEISGAWLHFGPWHSKIADVAIET